MKWFGRILYILFVLIIIGFIELIAGGVQGIRVSEYIYNNVTKFAIDNEDYNMFEGLGHLNAVSNTYFSQDPILNLDGQPFYDTTTETIDEKYQVKLGMYPHVVVDKNPQFDLYGDGVFILLESFSTEVAYYSLEVTGYYAQDPLKQKIVLKDRSYLNIYTDIRASNVNRASFRVALIANSSFANHLLEANRNLEFPEGYNFEYHIQAIDVFATFIDLDEPDNPERVHVYRLTDGTNFASGTPLALHENLNLAPETYNFSRGMNGVHPTADNNIHNLVLDYHPADLSPYNFAYWIVYSVYAVLFVVIPYFWFFHKQVMQLIKDKKGNNEPKDNNRKPQPQLFSDVEPKSDK